MLWLLLFMLVVAAAVSAIPALICFFVFDVPVSQSLLLGFLIGMFLLTALDGVAGVYETIRDLLKKLKRPKEKR